VERASAPGTTSAQVRNTMACGAAFDTCQETVMPYSGPEFEDTLRAIVEASQADRVLDIGVGAGKIGEIVKAVRPQAQLRGIEAEAGYRSRFEEAWKRYDKVWIGDAQEVSLDIASSRWNLVIFGDVLEHMPKATAIGLLDFWLPRCEYEVAVWPQGYLQDAYEGVRSEIHRCEIRLLDLALAGLPVARFHHYIRPDGKQAKCLAVIRGGRATQSNQAGIVT